MRFLRFSQNQRASPGLLDTDGQIRDLSGIIKDISSDVLEQFPYELFNKIDPKILPIVNRPYQLLPCVSNVGKIIGIALNYKLHAFETGSKLSTEPVIFLKATSAISGPYDDIVLPKGSSKTDWEVELGVVIGKRARNITITDAPDYIFGYCVVDDVSERAFQTERGGLQHTKGKSADTFCPIGPWLVTKDEIVNPQKLKLWTKVNKTIMQSGTTEDMIYSVVELVSYISEFMTLLPGDIIMTGTPDGVGKGHKPPLYLAEGDTVELGIENLGTQTHGVVGYHL